MQLDTDTQSPHTPLVAKLYTAVDAMNATDIVALVDENVQFRLGNFDAISGREAVEQANVGFFETILAMHHTITGIWSSGDTVFCEGRVHYTRKDKSTHEVPFAARLGLNGAKIIDYYVYVDISGL
ncbi:nuclear transport factor 2 family protein [Maritalea myrionectae]|uniref:nuclear transport factor 2 family protein n=1 Tax=Maritalea myrionectae TaxID=454601 RepID=UPI000419D52A|nr:nuclear transport factor 2 family protein [Maritalea myrionectae]